VEHAIVVETPIFSHSLGSKPWLLVALETAPV
jgi:hypothetical protein